MNKPPKFPVHINRNHLPEPEWAFPNAKIGVFAEESEPFPLHRHDRACPFRL